MFCLIKEQFFCKFNYCANLLQSIKAVKRCYVFKSCQFRLSFNPAITLVSSVKNLLTVLNREEVAVIRLGERADAMPLP